MKKALEAIAEALKMTASFLAGLACCLLLAAAAGLAAGLFIGALVWSVRRVAGW